MRRAFCLELGALIVLAMALLGVMFYVSVKNRDTMTTGEILALHVPIGVATLYLSLVIGKRVGLMIAGAHRLG